MLLTGRREACIPTMDTSIYLYVTTAAGMGMNTALTMGMMQRKAGIRFSVSRKEIIFVPEDRTSKSLENKQYMRRTFILLYLLMSIMPMTLAQKKFGCYAVGFYNQENLFDTIHDAGKNDYDFLPNGSYHWNKMKYEHKLANMAKVLLELGTDKLPGIGASVIGLSEVENDNALRDLTAQPAAMHDRRFDSLKETVIQSQTDRGSSLTQALQVYLKLL